MESLHLKISLVVTDKASDKDRREMERSMNQEVLDVARFPEIVFDSSNVSASRAGDGQYLDQLGGGPVHCTASLTTGPLPRK